MCVVCVALCAAEIRPREVTPGAFSSPTDFDMRYSAGMVDGVVRLTPTVEEVL